MILGVTLLVFVIMSFSPADPARLALGESASQEALENYREANGLNDPIWLRYFTFLAGMVRGDLGTSSGNVPVTEMVAHAFPITLQLTFLGLAIAIVLSAILGVLAALFRDRWVDEVIRLRNVALPALALGVPVAGSLTRVVRTAMVEELDRDYVRTAVGAGIPYPVVVSRNVLRNALIIPITVLGLRVGYLMGGAVIIEII